MGQKNGGIRKDTVEIDNNKLIEAMQKKDFSHTFVAKVIGVDRSSITNWTSGKITRIVQSKYDSLCALLEVDSLAPDPKPEPVVEVKPDIPSAKEATKELVELEAHVSSKELDIFRDMIKSQQEQIFILCSSLQSAIDALNEVAQRDTAALSEITIEAVNEDFRLWKQNVTRCANEVVSMNHQYKSTNAALSEAYKLLRSQYGIVWEQDKKEFLEVNGRAPVSTLELEYWIETTKPTHKNLLVAKLDTLCHKK